MKENKGVSLIEILVSIFIIALIAGPFTGMFLQSTRIRGSLSKQLKAIYAVRNEMEILMSMNSLEVCRSKGIKNSDGFFLRTSVAPYSIKAGTRYFYIMAKSLIDLKDQIIVFAPDAYRAFLLEGDGNTYTIDITIDESSYNLKVGDQSMSGSLKSSGKCDMQINLIEKQSSNYLDFAVTGNTDITVYTGDDNNWSMTHGNAYTVIDKCFYRDYSLLKIKIEAFEDIDLSRSLFEIENIIKASN